MAARFCAVGIAVLCAIISTTGAQNWQGHLTTYMVEELSKCYECLCQYWWGCSAYREYTCCKWVTRQRCANGWTQNGNYVCSIPICSRECQNGGRCIEPNTCDCGGNAIGQFCGTEICSPIHPCYPGNCYDDSKCNCTKGFSKTPGATVSDPGCTKIADDNKPFIGRSTTIISHFRNTRETLLYYFRLDATDETPDKRVVWSNQKIFNYLSFEFETRYVEPETMPDRPIYVHDFKYGIIGGKVEVMVFDFKNVSAGQHGTYNYTCPGITVSEPKQLMNCSIPDSPFKTLIEHGDTMQVILTAYSGGQRKILLSSGSLSTENLTGTEYKKQMEFKFDFEPAVHCSRNQTFTCNNGAVILRAKAEFTKAPIELEWQGWVDTDQYSAGVGQYRLELHRLEVKDETLELTEADPVLPVRENRVNHTVGTTKQPLFTTTFTPPEAGMYSIVMEVTDNANNSIFTRRFALYDPVSSVTANPQSAHGLHVTSAAPETGYRWQTKNGSVTVAWADYFMNKLHHEKKFLNKIKKFPTLFSDLETIGIRNVEKFVFDSYDDIEGARRKEAIPNALGITRFQYGYVVNNVSLGTPPEWKDIGGLNPNKEISLTSVNNGDEVTVWVRAFDILGNTMVEQTIVTIDVTQPKIVTNSTENKTSVFTPNAGKASSGYYYSRYEFYARDEESGVYQIELYVDITLANIGSVRNFRQVVNASVDKTKQSTDSACVPSKDPITCFLERQEVVLDNCWFLVPKKDYIINAGAIVSVSVYNQARLAVNTQFEIKQLNTLKGLEIYSGPENIRITNKRPDSFRIQWDLPKDRSCYDSAPIIIIISYYGAVEELRKHYLPSTTTFLDVAGLKPDTEYKISFFTQLGDSQTDMSDEFALKSVKTEKEDEEGVSTGLVAGIAIGVIALVVISIVVVVLLVRKGVIKNPEPVARITRAVTRRYRQSRYHEPTATVNPPKGMHNPSYGDPDTRYKTYDNNRPLSEDIYIPGGADVNVINVPLLRRGDITFDSTITTGRFAHIYKATLQSETRRETAVAKTLKENFSDNDRNLMNAKINFLGNYVGNHQNILKFIAAVTDDPVVGPFIVHEHCENGTLKEYLVKQRDHVTLQLQDNLFRFGLDIAKGMEYLASKSVVHRRLAARNVLLNFLYEVKITGFGPQPLPNEEGGVSNEEENIPIKWVAPECMRSTRDATEKSDVWSYAVTLWEVFSLGQTPYGKIQSREVPTRIKKGLRLEKPEQCDDTWYDVMKRCWSYEANRRPSFQDIREELDNLFAPRDGEIDTYYYTRR